MCLQYNKHMNTQEQQRKTLMKTWKSLPEPRVDWETFKRLAARMDLETAVQRAIRLATRNQ